MVKNKLLLKESELVELINSAVKTIQEQSNMVPTDLEGGGGGVTYYTSDGKIITNPSYIRLKNKETDDALNRSLGNSYRKTAKEICNKVLKNIDLTDRETEILNGERYMSELIMDCLQDNQPDLNDASGYHNVLMVLSIVFYVIAAIGTMFSWTGVGAYVAAASLVIATIIEFADGLGYILDDEPDYFMAGLTWVFMIVYPLAQAGKNVLRPITKKVSKVLSQGAKLGAQGAHKSLMSLTRSEKVILRGILNEYPKIKSGVILAKNKLTSDIAVVKKAYRGLRGYPGTDFAITQLKWVVKYILKPIKVGLELVANIIFMLSLWDPQLVSGGFTWLGQKTGWDSFDTLSSLFDSWAETGMYGKTAYKVLLDEYGTPRAVITTTPKDCTMETYSWLETKILYAKEFNINIDVTKDSEGLTDGIWEEWQKGWRPVTDISMIGNIQSVELALIHHDYYSKLLKRNESTLIDNGFLKEEIDGWGKVLGNCEAYMEAIKTKNKDLQDAITYLDMFAQKGIIKEHLK